MDKLTQRLISIDDKPKGIITYYKSQITGNEYDYTKYTNHGHTGNYRGFEDLPTNEYPYTLIYNNS